MEGRTDNVHVRLKRQISFTFTVLLYGSTVDIYEMGGGEPHPWKTVIRAKSAFASEALRQQLSTRDTDCWCCHFMMCYDVIL